MEPVALDARVAALEALAERERSAVAALAERERAALALEASAKLVADLQVHL